MIYAKLPTGDRWHILHNAKILCGCSGSVVEERTRNAVPDDGICGNCDNRLRELGRAKKPKPKWKKPDKAAYRPRNREKFE